MRKGHCRGIGKSGSLEGRRAACAKAQRCGKAELGVWRNRSKGAPKVGGMGGGQLQDLRPRPQGGLDGAQPWDPCPPTPQTALVE